MSIEPASGGRWGLKDRRSRLPREVPARDGLLARRTGGWAKDKLSFIDEFGPPALEVTTGKTHRFYLDLFAGPGRNVDKLTGEEFDGAALRALRLTSPHNERLRFTDVICVNKDPRHHRALAERVDALFERDESRVARDHVQLLQGDANLLLPSIMPTIPTRAYLFTFVDIEGIEHWPWRSVETLMSGHHESVDLYLLFPLEMAIRRLVSYNEEATRRYEHHLTAFFPSEAWRELVKNRITDAQSPVLWRELEAMYTEGLKRHWRYVQVVREVRQVGKRGLYKMLYATNHPVAKKLGGWATEKEASRDQYGLGF